MTVLPCCKINLGLQVTHRRDDGYHDIETVFVPIPLCDRLEIIRSDRLSFSQSGLSVDSPADDNLVMRAYRLMKETFGNAVGDVAIHLEKNIPFGAGLGGGSSDAAFTLKAVDQLFGLNAGTTTLQRLAASLGADCAFFLCDTPAYATGIGEKLTPLSFNPLQGLRTLLVKPPVAVSTAAAYRGITPRDQWASPVESYLPDLLQRPVTQWRDSVVNDFEATVFANFDILRQLKEELYAAGALYAAMSGSGATVYGLFAPSDDTESLRTSLARKYNAFSFIS